MTEWYVVHLAPNSHRFSPCNVQKKKSFCANKLPLAKTAKIAANCIRSLLLQASTTPADLSIARYLVPRLVTFVTNVEPEDPEQARAMVAHTLSLYVGTLPKDRVAAAMGLVIPTLMTRAAGEGEEVYSETSMRLLELAAADQVAFKGTVGALNSGQRTFLEEVIRSRRDASRGDADASESAESGQPTITLKMNFGGD